MISRPDARDGSLGRRDPDGTEAGSQGETNASEPRDLTVLRSEEVQGDIRAPVEDAEVRDDALHPRTDSLDVVDRDRERVTRLGTLDEERPSQRIGALETQALKRLARLEGL